MKTVVLLERNGLHVCNQQTKPGFGSNVDNPFMACVLSLRLREIKWGCIGSFIFSCQSPKSYLFLSQENQKKKEMAFLSASTKALISNSVLFHHQNRSFLPPHQKPTQLSFSSSSTGFGTISIAFERKGRPSLVGTAAVRHLEGSITRTEGLRFAVVVARFNEIITRPLLEGAVATFKKYSVKEDIDVVWVPGSFEVGIVAERLGKSGKYNAVVCIGAVVRGDTTHYDAVANSAASGVLSAGLKSGVPCIFGVLTCEDMEQAINRAGGKSGNKGAEAALTAIEMASLFEHHLK